MYSTLAGGALKPRVTMLTPEPHCLCLTDMDTVLYIIMGRLGEVCQIRQSSPFLSSFSAARY